MFGSDTDRSWEALGQKDPYYGVLTSDKYRKGNLNDAARVEFFKSGTIHIAKLLARIEELIGPVSRHSAVDFGCGVGRLALPLAGEEGFTIVTGVDVSDAMLNEAKLNTAQAGLSNLALVKSDDKLSLLSAGYDFVHSYIVLQHIPVSRGEVIVAQLLCGLAPGGVAALQIPFSRKVSWFRTLSNWLRVRVFPLHVIGNVIQGRPWNEPPMQMNQYNLNALLEIFHACGMQSVVIDFRVESGDLGAYLIARKGK